MVEGWEGEISVRVWWICEEMAMICDRPVYSTGLGVCGEFTVESVPKFKVLGRGGGHI